VPKTFTDDIAPAFPSSLDGPLQVVDPTDASSWIKVDPASGAIAAAGAARPSRRIASSYVRTYFSASAAAIGSVLAARSITTELLGGFYASPIRIPDDMDVTQPSDVTILVSPVQSATVNGQTVQFQFAHSIVPPGGTGANAVITVDWAVPNNWLPTDAAVVLMDNGNGRTFEANTLSAGDFLGFRCARLGSATEDTFNKSVLIAETLVFSYVAKEF